MTTLRLLLDTDVVSELVRPRPDAEVVSAFEREGAAAAIASVTWHELVYGVERLAAGKRRRLLERFLVDVVATRPILPYDERAARWHALERRHVERRGRVLPFEDGQIAAIAVTCGLTLVTRNVPHFASLRGLHVVSWHPLT